MNILLALFLSCISFAQTEIQDAKKSVISLIKPLMGGKSKRPPGTEKFRIDGCDKMDINWSKILLMQESVTLRYKFKENCDIEGTIKPKIFQPFPADFKIRNVQSYSHLAAENKITANLEAKPILNLAMRDGKLTGKKSKVKFEADYRVQINPISTDPLEKNLGGELRITEINGVKVNIKEKILID